MRNCQTLPVFIFVILVASVANAEELTEIGGSEFWPPFLGLRLKISDSLLVFFTMVLAYFTGLLWWSTNKLWQAGERQAVLTKLALVSNQRAWISVKMKIDSDFEATESHAGINVSLNIKNIGKSPALRVHTNMTMVVHGDDIPALLKDFCAGELVPNDKWSRLVLPDEEYDRPWGLTIDEAELKRNRLGQKYFWPVIFGCVSYQVVGDEDVHQTAFVYSVEQSANGEFSGFVDRIGITQKEKLVASVATGGFAT